MIAVTTADDCENTARKSTTGKSAAPIAAALSNTCAGWGNPLIEGKSCGAPAITEAREESERLEEQVTKPDHEGIKGRRACDACDK